MLQHQFPHDRDRLNCIRTTGTHFLEWVHIRRSGLYQCTSARSIFYTCACYILHTTYGMRTCNLPVPNVCWVIYIREYSVQVYMFLNKTVVTDTRIMDNKSIQLHVYAMHSLNLGLVLRDLCDIAQDIYGDFSARGPRPTSCSQ